MSGGADRLPAWANPEDEVITGELIGDIDPTVWRNFIGLVADGHTVPIALEKTKLSRYALNGLLRTNQKAKEQYEDAKLAAVRRNWDMETVEGILEDLMLCKHGGHLNRIIEDRGLDPASFYKLMRRDEHVKQMYEESREIQAEVMADKIREIADDGTNDTYVDDRGNVRVDQDVMGRSRIRVDTMKWVMSKLHHKRFGDKIQQEVDVNLKVDIADKLRAGRARVAELASKRAKG